MLPTPSIINPNFILNNLTYIHQQYTLNQREQSLTDKKMTKIHTTTDSKNQIEKEKKRDRKPHHPLVVKPPTSSTTPPWWSVHHREPFYHTPSVAVVVTSLFDCEIARTTALISFVFPFVSIMFLFMFAGCFNFLENKG